MKESKVMTGPQADFWFSVTPRQSEWTGQFTRSTSLLACSLGGLNQRREAIQSC